jgi:hypothetical protein
MRSAPAHHDPAYGSITGETGLTRPAVDLELFLEATVLAPGTPIGSVTQRGALIGHSAGEHPADGMIQTLGFLVVEGVCCAERVESGGEEGFVGVDIAQPCQEPLVEQQGLQPTSPPGKQVPELLQDESFIEWLRPKLSDYLSGIPHQVSPAQFADVSESQLVPVIQRQSHVGMSVAGLRAGRDREAAAHHEVKE